MEFLKDTRLALVGSLMHTKVGLDQILLETDRGLYVGLNEQASVLVDAIRDGWTLSHIHAHMVATYDAPEEQIWSDVVALAKQMVELDLVSVA